MSLQAIWDERKRVRQYFLAGLVIGIIYSILEYVLKLGTDDEQVFVPLLFRACGAVALIFSSVAVFEILMKGRFNQRTFLYVLTVRSLVYMGIITLWLLIVNGIWYTFNDRASPITQLQWYLSDDMYPINLATILVCIVVVVGIGAINSLHRKGELRNYILGRYHEPREVDRIFCFIDLKNSTAIAERLGHLRFARFLRDYYSDLTEAIQKTEAQVYQYVGDEIVLSWSYQNGLQNQNAIRCYFLMQDVFHQAREKYLAKFGVYPEFRAGLHGGEVVVTWVGEAKKEIVYIGDVVNTTARIQEDCKRLGSDFLVSEDLLKELGPVEGVLATFKEETIPRGKATSVRLYSLTRH